MKRWMVWTMVLCLLLGTCSMAAAGASGENYQIVPLQGYEYRVKLRSRPSKGGDILGQYYAGTEMTVYSIKDGWAKVNVGGRDGYMQSEFLTPSDGSMAETMLGMIIPTALGEVTMQTVDGAKLQIPEIYIHVLGTVDEHTVHVAYTTADGVQYGYIASDRVSHVDNFAMLTIRGDKADQRINVREEPDKSAAVMARLYPGVRVYRVFDDHTADDGWVRINVGGMNGPAGYVMDEFLDDSSAGVAAYRPRPVVLRDQTTVVGGSCWGSIQRNEPMWLLGTSGANSGDKMLYCCEAMGWDPKDGTRYIKDTCFFRKKYMGSAEISSVSTAGRVTRATVLYSVDEAGNRSPVTVEINGKTVTELPVGTSLRIYTGVREPGKEPSYQGYVMPDDPWLQVEAELPGMTVDGFVAIDCVTYDPGLNIPEAWTNG